VTLGRKYPWQQEQWRQFVRLDELNRLPHGLLFAGPGETGKRDFALRAANYLLCSSPSEGEPCLKCKTCQLFEGHSHPDFWMVEPEEQGRLIKVDQIRQLSEFASKTAAMGGRRVILLQPAENMNINAANAFLKTLEEPGEGVCLILVSHEPARLLATIRSRCRLFPFSLPPSAETRAWLESESGAAAEVEQALALSGGRPLRALRLLDSELRQQWQMFQETMNALESNHMPVLDAARVLQGLQKTDAIEWFQYLVYKRIRAMSVEQQGAPPLVFRFLDRLNEARQRLISPSNLNVLLVWEEVLMDWRAVVDLEARKQG
jgi:DNA polymerase III subunit delta'